LLRDDGEGSCRKGQHLFGHINMETLATIHKKLTPVISEIAQLENLPELEAHSPQISILVGVIPQVEKHKISDLPIAWSCNVQFKDHLAEGKGSSFKKAKHNVSRKLCHMLSLSPP